MNTKIISLFTDDTKKPLFKNVSKERMSLCQPRHLELPFCLLKNSQRENNRKTSVSNHGCCSNILEPRGNFNSQIKGGLALFGTS